jgi:hypothetical protein
VLEIPFTRAKPDTSRPAVGTTHEDEQPLPEKRPRIERVEHLKEMSYWPNCSEARQVFHSNTLSKRRRRTTTTSAADDNNDESFAPSCNEETAKDAVERRILLLKSEHESEDGWRNVIIGRDGNNYCTKLEILRFGRGRHFLFTPIRLRWWK